DGQRAVVRQHEAAVGLGHAEARRVAARLLAERRTLRRQDDLDAVAPEAEGVAVGRDGHGRVQMQAALDAVRAAPRHLVLDRQPPVLDRYAAAVDEAVAEELAVAPEGTGEGGAGVVFRE